MLNLHNLSEDISNAQSERAARMGEVNVFVALCCIASLSNRETFICVFVAHQDCSCRWKCLRDLQIGLSRSSSQNVMMSRLMTYTRLFASRRLNLYSLLIPPRYGQTWTPSCLHQSCLGTAFNQITRQFLQCDIKLSLAGSAWIFAQEICQDPQ